MTDVHAIEHAGDPRHPEHSQFLAELGRATYLAARVAGVSFDILRVFDNAASETMYRDPLGVLCEKLETLAKKQKGATLPGLFQFLVTLRAAKDTRDDLLHALPVKDGLHRRDKRDLSKVRNFFDVRDVSTASKQLEDAWKEGNKLLYHDGGDAVQAWYAAGGS